MVLGGASIAGSSASTPTADGRLRLTARPAAPLPPSAIPLQTRQRLCRRILTGLHVLAGSRAHRPLLEAVAAVLFKAQPDRWRTADTVPTCEVFESLGCLPLLRLLQLQAYLALVLACLCTSPGDALNTWFEGLQSLLVGDAVRGTLRRRGDGGGAGAGGGGGGGGGNDWQAHGC